MKTATKTASEKEVKRALVNLRNAGVDQYDAVDKVTDTFENRGVTYQMVYDLSKKVFK